MIAYLLSHWHLCATERQTVLAVLDILCYLQRMPRPRGPATEMVRLPSDVVRALRRRATTADITIAEAARQLMQPTDVQHPLGLIEHVAWLHTRLVRRREDLVSVFEDGDADSKVVDAAIDALAVLLKDWPEDTGYDFTTHGMGQPQ